ncbi:hypothetical protein LTR36_002102 [Oleoguttula mirabilis]|uniref:F-box protein n=1 Tax=Oleoguttula mirabilis TaxID=1507867 RepID=A0AAV9JN52_9PEZI|nr:hypothetical protein LTR36_002102 [Oleoguttula mirabilis]
MEASPLNKLPREIRDHIYELALTQSAPIEVHLCYTSLTHLAMATPRASNMKVETKEAVIAFAGLPTVCRQLRHEARSVFFASNGFRFVPIGDDEGDSEIEWMKLQRWLSFLGVRNIKHIKSCTLKLGRYYIEDLSQSTSQSVGRSLALMKRYLHPTVVFTVELTFDWLDFDGVLDIDGPITAGLRIPVGDARGASQELATVINNMAENYFNKHDITDEAEKWIAAQPFQDFGNMLGDAVQDMAHW